MAKRERTIERTKSQMDLKHALTDEERSSYGDELAKKTQEVETLEDRKKEIASQIKGEIEAAQGIARLRARTISQGYEYRMTDVEITKDWDLGEVITVRMDTEEIVESRPMRDHERQVPIRLQAAGESVE